jgi:cobalt-zinc-cadmium efflux system protein
LPILDPLLSLGITAWVLWNVWRNLRDTFRILLQATPTDIDIALLTAEIDRVQGVKSIHDLHVWSQDGVTHVMTLHAVTAEGVTPEQSHQLIEAIRAIGHSHKIDHVTVEIESSATPDCEYASEEK